MAGGAHGALLSVLENTADGAWISSAKGEIIAWNRAAEAMLGYPREDALGQCCRHLVAGRARNGAPICGSPCPIRGRLQSGDLVEHFQMATTTSAGQSVRIDMSCVAFVAEAGQPPAILHLFREVLREPLVDEPAGNPSVADLTPRERQILLLMRRGTTTGAIAAELGISRTTVRNHIQNIFAKLNVHSRLEAVAHVNRLAADDQ